MIDSINVNIDELDNKAIEYITSNNTKYWQQYNMNELCNSQHQLLLKRLFTKLLGIEFNIQDKQTTSFNELFEHFENFTIEYVMVRINDNNLTFVYHINHMDVLLFVLTHDNKNRNWTITRNKELYHY